MACCSEINNSPQFFDFNELDYSSELVCEYEDPLGIGNDTTLPIDKLYDLSLKEKSHSLVNLNEVGIQSRNGKVYNSSSAKDILQRPSRTFSQETINRLAQPKRYNSVQNLHEDSYMTAAERFSRCQSSTSPERFRNKPKLKAFLRPTIPYSPKLKTAARSRPVNELSQQEKEMCALEEMKKSQFKAKPLNKNIFKSPIINNKEKRLTVVEPFNLTTVSRKVLASPVKNHSNFHAKPAPKSATQPKIKQALQPTKPLPFSFETRDIMCKTRKEQLVQKVLEEEKKNREFHANPIPKSVLKVAEKQRSDRKLQVDRTSPNLSSFKARPPTVLQKPPFKPKLEHRLLPVEKIILETDIRSKEREQFEQKLKEKEEQIAKLKALEELYRKQKEEEALIIARKNAEFKASQIKKFKQVEIQPSNKFTIPQSPKFSLKNSNKENIF